MKSQSMGSMKLSKQRMANRRCMFQAMSQARPVHQTQSMDDRT